MGGGEGEKERETIPVPHARNRTQRLLGFTFH
jgi:hypothetical protein